MGNNVARRRIGVPPIPAELQLRVSEIIGPLGECDPSGVMKDVLEGAVLDLLSDHPAVVARAFTWFTIPGSNDDPIKLVDVCAALGISANGVASRALAAHAQRNERRARA